MSNIKIRDLPEKNDNLDDDDLIIIEDKEDTKKISLIKLRTGFSMDGILTSMKNMLINKMDAFILDHSTKYNELLSRNSDLEVICYNLQNDHDHDAERIFELENRLVIEQNNVVNLQTEKNNLLKLISQLQIDKDNLSEQIILLNKQLETNQSNIAVLQSQVKDLQLKAKELKEVNDELQNLVDKLQKDSQTEIDSNYQEIYKKYSDNIEDLMAYIRYYHPDVDDIFK